MIKFTSFPQNKTERDFFCIYSKFVFTSEETKYFEDFELAYEKNTLLSAFDE